MTKKDFELIARIFNKNISETDSICLKNNVPKVAAAMAQQFADILGATNPLFDRERFLKACGIERKI